MSKKKTAVIISISSDTGYAIAKRKLEQGWAVIGTYRNNAGLVSDIFSRGAKVVKCDLTCTESVNNASSDIKGAYPNWDALIVCPGTFEPIGPFEETDFDKWEASVHINFTRQIQFVYNLLPSRKFELKHGPCVIFFSGGNTNEATVNYSAYTVSKIALIKMTELLSAETPDTRFTIIGPGWVKTKIHDETLRAKQSAGDNYKKTLEKISSEECTPMDKVLDHCDWVINSPNSIVSGRNFSTVNDKWGSKELNKQLEDESDMYKLRRSEK